LNRPIEALTQNTNQQLLDERIGLLATVDCPGVFVAETTHARISNHSIATIALASGWGAALATRCAACVCSMKNEDAQYSRCLAPTCPRLLEVMPEDVSPRDNQDEDHGPNAMALKSSLNASVFTPALHCGSP